MSTQFKDQSMNLYLLLSEIQKFSGERQAPSPDVTFLTAYGGSLPPLSALPFYNLHLQIINYASDSSSCLALAR
jgi:hypothetical protein